MPLPCVNIQVGDTFGRLTVIEETDVVISGKSYRAWGCLCECGELRVIRAPNLISGHTQSCGCLRRDLLTVHGHAARGAKSPEYHAYRDMMRRCFDPHFKQFKDYGGRGITVCQRWQEGFPNFLADMGPRPSPELTLERQDNDGNYEPNNCTWATRLDQTHNRRPRDQWSKKAAA